MGSSVSFNKIALAQWYWEGSSMYGKKGFMEASKSFSPIPKNALHGKIIVITGANQGLGFEAARQCAILGAAEVHLLCRTPAKGQEAAERINSEFTEGPRAFSHRLDVGEFAQVRDFAMEFSRLLRNRGKHVDVLINNAGCMPTSLTKTTEGKEAITACTFGGCMLLTGLLLRSMKRGSHVINVSSGGAYTVAPRVNDLNFDEVKESDYDGTLFYAYAKRHQILITQLFAEKFTETTGVRFSSMHPGWADTEAVRSSMSDFYSKHKDTLRTTGEGADTILYLAASPCDDPKLSGLFWFDRKAVRTDMPGGGTTASPNQLEELWKNAKHFVGLSDDDLLPPS